MSFKKDNSFEKRLNGSKYIKNKYPDRIPIIVEIADTDKNSIILDKKKFIVPKDLTIAQFIFVIRKRIKLQPEHALFIFFDNKIPTSSTLISEIYNKNKDEDGFLYADIALELTFGYMVYYK